MFGVENEGRFSTLFLGRKSNNQYWQSLVSNVCFLRKLAPFSRLPGYFTRGRGFAPPAIGILQARESTPRPGFNPKRRKQQRWASLRTRGEYRCCFRRLGFGFRGLPPPSAQLFDQACDLCVLRALLPVRPQRPQRLAAPSRCILFFLHFRGR